MKSLTYILIAVSILVILNVIASEATKIEYFVDRLLSSDDNLWTNDIKDSLESIKWMVGTLAIGLYIFIFVRIDFFIRNKFFNFNKTLN